MSDFVFFHKCRLGQYNLNLHSFVQRRPEPKYLIRSHDSNNFIELERRTNSYFRRVVRAQNAISNEIKLLGSNLSFERAIKTYFLSKNDSYELSTCK